LVSRGLLTKGDFTSLHEKYEFQPFALELQTSFRETLF
jgi:hypothetical protein